MNTSQPEPLPLPDLAEEAEPVTPGPVGRPEWQTVTRAAGGCVDCWADQGRAYALGRVVPLRQAARVRYTSTEGATALLCTQHAMARGWRGRA